MDCPLCFADAGAGIQPDLEEVEQMLDDYVRTEGNPEVVQFSGGEPTIHPQIIDFVRAAQARGIRFVMLNTNGKRIAEDDRFLEQLNQVRPVALFSVRRIRMRRRTESFAASPTSWPKNSALWTGLRISGLSVTLVPAIERGVNEHEIGKIIEFAISASGRPGNQLPTGVSLRPSHAARSAAPNDDPRYRRA